MKNINPLDLIDRLLEDYLSPKARRTLHTVLVLVALAVTAMLTYEGDWREALFAFAATVYTWANRANTGVATLAEAKSAFCGEPEYDGPEVEDTDWDTEQPTLLDPAEEADYRYTNGL